MTLLVHSLIHDRARASPEYAALKYNDRVLNYAELSHAVQAFAGYLVAQGLKRGTRVAIYAEKRFEAVIAMFGIAQAGGVYVPINPLLKSEQVAHILNDAGAKILVTTGPRLGSLVPILDQLPVLETIIVADAVPDLRKPKTIVSWSEAHTESQVTFATMIDGDMAAILYTSGSTGKPKGVVLSHRNIVAGAQSVAQYLELGPHDRVLSVLPLSFDYGMNQLTSTFLAGGLVVLMNYLMPQDILLQAAKEKITGLAAVPPLWIQLAHLKWPDEIKKNLRYFTNSGGHMPRDTLAALRAALPQTKPYLMYGLTEAFRSTYLPPGDIDARPDSMGRAIPNAEILVVRSDGTLCDPGEPGELVHRGVHVALGYWGDVEKTNLRFKPAPGQDPRLPIPEIAVWSGDTVKKDKDGYLYYVGRQDEMIKTSGFRVSPTEIEELFYATKLVDEVVAFGLPHPVLGQTIAVVAMPTPRAQTSVDDLRLAIRERVPSYMIPSVIRLQHEPLPRNPNGKIDRKLLAAREQEQGG